MYRGALAVFRVLTAEMKMFQLEKWLLDLQIFQIKDELENESIQYPSYYLQPFHAYENGNLDWTAAFENESATTAMAWRVYKDPAISALEAQNKMRSSIFDCFEVSIQAWLWAAGSKILLAWCKSNEIHACHSWTNAVYLAMRVHEVSANVLVNLNGSMVMPRRAIYVVSLRQTD